MAEAKFGFGAHTKLADTTELLGLAQQADRDGLDLFSLSDHPYVGNRLDAYAAIGFILGQTQHLSGFANVTNLPLRPAPMLARTAAGLTELSRGRFVLGLGAGGFWDKIATMGVPELGGGEAVEAMEDSIRLVKRLLGAQLPAPRAGHDDNTEIRPSRLSFPPPPVWTGSGGPKSLAVTGRVADGWIPGNGADWRSDRYQQSRPIVDEAARSVGRDPAEVKTIFNLSGVIAERDLPRTRDQETGAWIGGSADQWVEELTEAVLEDEAYGFVLFSPEGGAPDRDSLARWGREIVPRVREAIT